ncbi:hypothetical protein V8F33_000867 [Rhypophila sp. PSN 637]
MVQLKSRDHQGAILEPNCQLRGNMGVVEIPRLDPGPVPGPHHHGRRRAPDLQYLADNFTQISGGIGVFDPSTVMPTVQGPMIAQYVYRTLNDPRLSFQTVADQAVTPECQSNKLVHVIPPDGRDPHDPTTSLAESQRSSVDSLRGQGRTFVPARNMGLVRHHSRVSLQRLRAVQREIKRQSGVLFMYEGRTRWWDLAGYAPCYPFDGPAQCRTEYTPTRAIHLSIWITKIRIYRLKTSFIADRRTGSILSLLTSSITNSPPLAPVDPPLFQPIPVSSLRKAINAIICPHFSNQTSTPTFGTTLAYAACDKMMPNFLLTDSIASLLAYAADLKYSPGLIILQNLFASVLFLFNPVWETQIGMDQNVVLEPNGLVPGLLDENYFTGSMSRPVEYVAPAGWTVIAFMICGALLLLLCAVGMIVSVVITGGYYATGRAVGETSSFPLVDAGLLDVKDQGLGVGSTGNAGQVKAMADVFEPGGGMEDKNVIKIAARSEIRMR